MPKESDGDVDLAFAMVATGRYSQKQIARHCRVSQPTVSRMERRWQEMGCPPLEKLPSWTKVRQQTGNTSLGATVGKLMRSVEKREEIIRGGQA